MATLANFIAHIWYLHLPSHVIKFYRNLVAASKPSEINLIPFASFDPDCALWPSNRCADIIFEMSYALALHLDQTVTLNLYD
jgi:hypothetical protein